MFKDMPMQQRQLLGMQKQLGTWRSAQTMQQSKNTLRELPKRRATQQQQQLPVPNVQQNWPQQDSARTRNGALRH